MEAAVLRTEAFHQVFVLLRRGQYTNAIDRLIAIRTQYQHDRHSQVEIDRWIAQALEESGRFRDSLSLYTDIEAQLLEFGYDMSNHYLAIVSLLGRLQRRVELQQYCERIDEYHRSEDAFGHIRWIKVYCESDVDQKPTSFMRTVVADCRVQLGIQMVPSTLAADSFCAVVQECCHAIDAANERYRSFRDEYQRLIATSASERSLEHHVEAFVRSEPSPFFRQIARA